MTDEKPTGMIRKLVDAICFRLVHGPLNSPPSFQIDTLHVRPGDRLIVQYDGLMSREVAEKIRAVWETKVPTGVVVIVIDKSTGLSVLKQCERVREAA